MKKVTITLIGLAVMMLGLSLAGCTTKRQAFPNHTPNQVWTAMRAVAESPEYDDWRVTANDVWVDENDARIEVFRETRRTLHRAGAKPLDQRRAYRFRMLLDGEDPPTVTFVSRGMGIPAHAQAEADRYLVDVRRMLQSEVAPRRARPAAAETEDATQPDDLNAVPAPPTDDAASRPPVDVDDLD